jgi:hypothetical protein
MTDLTNFVAEGRFRILKQGFYTHSKTLCDHIFYTCCVLHNILLMHDDLDVKHWNLEGADGSFGGDGINDPLDEFDGPHDNDHAYLDPAKVDIAGGMNLQREPEHFELRDKLVKHYAIAWQRGEVRWLNSAHRAGPL